MSERTPGELIFALLDVAKEYAANCPCCDGNGKRPHSFDRNVTVDCQHCRHVRAVLAMAMQSGDASVLAMAAGPALLTACKAQHEAIDRLFAMLIEVTGDREPFYPIKSGQPWEAVLIGNAAIAKATQP